MKIYGVWIDNGESYDDRDTYYHEYYLSRESAENELKKELGNLNKWPTDRYVGEVVEIEVRE